MEHNNGPLIHHGANLVNAVKEGLFKQVLIVDVDGTLDVTKSELIVKSTVHNDNWVI